LTQFFNIVRLEPNEEAVGLLKYTRGGTAKVLHCEDPIAISAVQRPLSLTSRSRLLSRRYVARWTGAEVVGENEVDYLGAVEASLSRAGYALEPVVGVVRP
jgi:hypothetical protein